MRKILVSLVFLAAIFMFSVSCGEKKKTPAPASNSAPAAVSSNNLNDAVKYVRLPSAKKAAEFSLPSIAEGRVTLSQYKGKIVILDFWATWCPPCKAEIPFFIELQNEYKNDVVFIGAAIDDMAKVKAFSKSYGINYPIGIADNSVTGAYGGVRGIPTTFVIDRDGYIYREYVGFRPKEVFEADIKTLL